MQFCAVDSINDSIYAAVMKAMVIDTNIFISALRDTGGCRPAAFMDIFFDRHDAEKGPAVLRRGAAAGRAEETERELLHKKNGAETLSSGNGPVYSRLIAQNRCCGCITSDMEEYNWLVII